MSPLAVLVTAAVLVAVGMLVICLKTGVWTKAKNVYDGLRLSPEEVERRKAKRDADDQNSTE